MLVSKMSQKQRLIKDAKLHGAKFARDNFTVAQWLQTALADGLASVCYLESHSGDGRRGYRAFYKAYKSRSKRDTRAQEIHNKLKTLQYRGTKNFPWEKFNTELLTYYAELKTLKQKVSNAQQVRDLIPMIVHERTKGIAIDVVTDDKKAKGDLEYALAKIGEKMTLKGTLTSTGEGGPGGTTNPQRQIKKLQQQVAKLKKKTGGGQGGRGNGGGGGGKQQGSNKYIPLDVIAAIKDKGCKKSGLYLSWLYNGRNKSEDQDEADDDDGQAFIGDEEEDIPTSASSAFGHKSQNRHVDPKSSKKQRTQGKVAIVKSTRLTVRAQATIQQLSDHSQHFCAEMDSRADRVCAGSAFRLVDEKVGRVADVASFHPDMEKMKDIPIVTVATAIDLSHVNETVI
jgi:hypothetical protein